MENYKRKVKNRLIFAGIYCAIILILIAVAMIDSLNDSATAFNLGFGIGIELVVIFFMGKYFGALKSDDKLKKLYVEENDERRKHIDSKIGSTGINITILFIVTAMLIFNYFNQTVFITLLAVTLFIVTVKIVLKLYYNNKI